MLAPLLGLQAKMGNTLLTVSASVGEVICNSTDAADIKSLVSVGGVGERSTVSSLRKAGSADGDGQSWDGAGQSVAMFCPENKINTNK